jgi:hypothetical protein
MSLRWTPKWVTKVISVGGKDVEVCYDEVTKLYACPFCAPHCRSGGLGDRGSYFFSEKDLIEHIKAHKLALWEHRKFEEQELEEEEEEEADEEE